MESNAFKTGMVPVEKVNSVHFSRAAKFISIHVKKRIRHLSMPPYRLMRICFSRLTVRQESIKKTYVWRHNHLWPDCTLHPKMQNMIFPWGGMISSGPWWIVLPKVFFQNMPLRIFDTHPHHCKKNADVHRPGSIAITISLVDGSKWVW